MMRNEAEKKKNEKRREQILPNGVENRIIYATTEIFIYAPTIGSHTNTP